MDMSNADYTSFIICTARSNGCKAMP